MEVNCKATVKWEVYVEFSPGNGYRYTKCVKTFEDEKEAIEFSNKLKSLDIFEIVVVERILSSINIFDKKVDEIASKYGTILRI